MLNQSAGVSSIPLKQDHGRPRGTVERKGGRVVSLRDSRGGLQALRQRWLCCGNRRD